MAVYYEVRAPLWRRIFSFTSVHSRVFKSIEFWLCLLLHGALAASQHLGSIQLAEQTSIPLQLAAPLLALALLASAAHAATCKRRYEETLSFIQELQATLGQVNEVLALRFVAAKYALASCYVFFFTITGGAVATRGWNEIRAKGLLDDDELRFLERQYHGDRMALLHVWAMWAAGEACADPSARDALGEEVLAAGLARMSSALRISQVFARGVAAKIAMPLPYVHVQLCDTLVMLALLLWAALSAMPAVSSFGASVAYTALLYALLGFREIAAILSDPLGPNAYAFPVASTVNAAADVAAQLIVASTPPAFNPNACWREKNKMLFTQAQVERRTPKEAFARKGGSPCAWPPVKAPLDGDHVPPPLTAVGCCHLDTEALPQLRSLRAGHGFQVARRPTQEALGALLRNVRLEADVVEERKKSRSMSTTINSTANPSSVCSTLSQWERKHQVQHAYSGGQRQATATDDWNAIADKIAAVPREPSVASEQLTNWAATKQAATTSGAWDIYDVVERPLRFFADGVNVGAGRSDVVSPSDVGPVSLANSRDMEPLRHDVPRHDTLQPGMPSSLGTSTPDAYIFGCS